MAPGLSPEFPEKLDGALIEGRDFTWEQGLMVMTARYLLRRGYCCENGCRNCPYDSGSSSKSNESPDEGPESSRLR